MAFTAIEWIALILSVLGLLKLVFVIFNKTAWYNGVTKKVYGNRAVSAIVFVLLALVIFYYLIQEMNIVQIMAVVAFSSLLTGLGFLYFSKELLSVLDKAINKKFGFGMWIYILIWIILFVWTLWSIFA